MKVSVKSEDPIRPSARILHGNILDENWFVSVKIRERHCSENIGIDISLKTLCSFNRILLERWWYIILRCYCWKLCIKIREILWWMWCLDSFLEILGNFNRSCSSYGNISYWNATIETCTYKLGELFDDCGIVYISLEILGNFNRSCSSYGDITSSWLSICSRVSDCWAMSFSKEIDFFFNVFVIEKNPLMKTMSCFFQKIQWFWSLLKLGDMTSIPILELFNGFKRLNMMDSNSISELDFFPTVLAVEQVLF